MELKKILVVDPMSGLPVKRFKSLPDFQQAVQKALSAANIADESIMPLVNKLEGITPKEDALIETFRAPQEGCAPCKGSDGPVGARPTRQLCRSSRKQPKWRWRSQTADLRGALMSAMVGMASSFAKATTLQPLTQAGINRFQSFLVWSRGEAQLVDSALMMMAVMSSTWVLSLQKSRALAQRMLTISLALPPPDPSAVIPPLGRSAENPSA